MKANKVDVSARRKLTVAISVGLLLAAIIGLAFGYGKLHELWLEQCQVVDMEKQVSISPGKMVKADVIAEEFGLHVGANLATIDFSERRKQILAKIPNLRSIEITRRLPDKVEIATEERTPIARLNQPGRKTVSGRVVDSDGVVFICQRGTAGLPTIYEKAGVISAPGSHLDGRMLAALHLVEISRESGFLELGILDIDVAKSDFLTATLGNYSRAKIAWEGMGETTEKSKKSLSRQLTLLVKAFRNKSGENTVIWNATDTSEPGCIYANSKENENK